MPRDRRTDAPCPPEMARLFSLLALFWRSPEPVERIAGECVFVHAGVLPARNPEEMAPGDLLWRRDGFVDGPPEDGRTVVCGHTPTDDGRPRVPGDGRIGLDTGARFGGPLTALELPAKRV